jgi:hypothetical protein
MRTLENLQRGRETERKRGTIEKYADVIGDGSNWNPITSSDTCMSIARTGLFGIGKNTTT